MTKKNIAILGSTGSIGKQTLEVIKNDKNNFNVILLSTNSNIKEISKQIKIFRPRSIIISNKKKFTFFKKKNKKIKIFNDYSCFEKIFSKKVDYVMSSITGFNGLQPTIEIIKHTKLLAIANKESIICGWNLIQSELKKNKTKFIPVDSEHFSIWKLTENNNHEIDKIFITASGGPFLNKKRRNLMNIKPKHAIKHPKWKMGKKISIDSATMVNKLFELIEANKIFNIDIKNIKILSHPNSYVHAIVKFKNGLTKILIHDTNMKIPIFNTLYNNQTAKIKSNDLDIKKLNDLNLNYISLKQFPSLRLINLFNYKKNSLLETVLVSANDELVDLFLKKKINFLDISTNLISILNLKEFKKLRSKKPNNLAQIMHLNRYVRLKTRTLCVRSNSNV